MADRKKGQTEMGFGDEMADEQTNVQSLPASREKFKQPPSDEQRSKLYTLVATLLQGGLTLDAAAKHVMSEGATQMAIAAEAFFLPLNEIRTHPGADFKKEMDHIIKDAFGRHHVELDENVILQAMAIAPSLVPLLQTASQFARQAQAGRREGTDVSHFEDVRRKA